MLRSDLCDFSDAYIVVKGDITVTEPDNAKRNKSVAFKNNAPFINYISKINGIQISKAENLDVVISLYNLLEYSKNYKKTTRSLWNCYRDEPSDPLSSNSESFKYKTRITGNTYNFAAGNANYNATKVVKNETVVIPLKYLNNFWRTLNIPLINCEIELILTWSKNCVLADMTAGNNPPTGLEFQITDTTLSVPVVTLSKKQTKKKTKKQNTFRTIKIRI